MAPRHGTTGRDLLTGWVEVDECYVGGLEGCLPGRRILRNVRRAASLGCQ